MSDITKHDWKIIGKNMFGKPVIGTKKGYLICELVRGNDEVLEANAALISEAGTVHNETGYTPRELAEQKDDLLAACKALLHINKEAKSPQGCKGSVADKARKQARVAISNATK